MRIHLSLRTLAIALTLTLLGPITYAQSTVVVSAASFLATSQARGGIAAAFGLNLSIGTASATTNPLPLTLSGTTLTLRDSTGTDHSVRLFYVSPSQINFLVPAGASVGPALLTIQRSDGHSQTAMFTVTSLQPSLFAANKNGQGVAAAQIIWVAPDDSQQILYTARFVQFDTGSSGFLFQPIDFGPQGWRVFLVLYGTGFSIGGNGLASVGGLFLTPGFVGAQGEFAGLDQANIELPRALQSRGIVDVTLSVNGITSNVVQIQFR
jgi:uncharacterized protein (TIGR03437 family)